MTKIERVKVEREALHNFRCKVWEVASIEELKQCEKMMNELRQVIADKDYEIAELKKSGPRKYCRH